MMYDFLDQLRTFEPLALDPFQNIKDFMARIERIPAIKEFLESEYFRNRPISNKMAQWGTKPIPRQWWNKENEFINRQLRCDHKWETTAPWNTCLYSQIKTAVLSI